MDAKKETNHRISKFGRLVLAALVLGGVFDLLFWKQPLGISFPIFVTVCLLVGFWLANVEGRSPSVKSLLLLAPILFFAVMTFLRGEPVTLLLDFGLTLFFLAVLTSTFQGGQWFNYSLVDYGVKLILLGVSVIAQPLVTMSDNPKIRPEDELTKRVPWKSVWPILRGLLLAVPVVAVFTGLLASADPIFEQKVDVFLELFNIENLWDYIGQAFLIAIVGYSLTGVYLHMLLKSKDQKLIKQWIKPFMGFTEAAIVLGSVNVLFLTFVIVQFQYFFGGQSNIHIAGYTYAEYARRGFGELVSVAFLSLILFISLSSFARRTAGNQRKIFSAFGIVLLLQVGIILVSAFQRLLLYEEFYGFSRFRTYPHVFMVWLGILLLGVVVLEIMNKQQAFALAVVLAIMSFAVTLNIINVDAFIARKNVDLAQEGEQLDIAYLASLSDDVVPVLAEMLQDEEYDLSVRNEIGAALGCYIALNDEESQDDPWQTYHLSRARAVQAEKSVISILKANQNLAYKDSNGDLVVLANGEEQYCIDYYYYSD
jgi:hypothetical protein